MNSVHELIAFFVQRGSCIESIYLRKEKQRHFCQDTYFRSPPKIAIKGASQEKNVCFQLLPASGGGHLQSFGMFKSMACRGKFN